LEQTGYRQLSLEAVARGAGTTKPALYRRWPTRQHLVLAALATRLGQLDAPATDCTLCDLADGIKVFVAAFTRMPPDVLAPLLADCTADPDLHRSFMTALFDPPRAAADRVLSRAPARGDLREDLDRDLALDLLGSLVHYRTLFQHAPTTDADIEQAVHTLLRGMATDYPRLVDISRRKTGDPTIHPQHT